MVLFAAMVCGTCGMTGHDTTTCPSKRDTDEDQSRRGLRVSPRTPAKEDDAKLAKLRKLSEKLSPNAGISDAAGSESVLGERATVVPPMPHGLKEELSQGTPVTMEAMTALLSAQLSAQLAPLTGSVNRLETELSQFKVKVDGDLEEVKKTTNLLKEDLVKVQSRVDKVERHGGSDALEQRVKEIEQAISQLKVSPAAGGKDQRTAIVGGLQDASSADAAKSWLKDAMDKVRIDGVLDVYDKCQGREFNGVVFVKFSSVEKRDLAIRTFNDSTRAFNESRKFMNEDLPLKQRAKFNFLRNFKKLLVEWEFRNISFDVDSSNISVAGVPILEAAVEGYTFTPKWLDSQWGQWEFKELTTNDQKFQELVETAENKLKQASESHEKGKGKAKKV